MDEKRALGPGAKCCHGDPACPWCGGATAPVLPVPATPTPVLPPFDEHGDGPFVDPSDDEEEDA